MLRRIQVDNTIEDKIITALITSTQYCREIQPIFDKKLLSNDYVKIVAEWTLSYYNQYKTAPGNKIQDIYDIESGKLRPETAEIISKFLEKISSEYAIDDSFNYQFYLDKTFTYFKKQALKNMTERVSTFLELDQIEEAEREIDSRKKILLQTSGWMSVLTEESVNQFFVDEKDKTHELFRLNGAVGNLIGTLERNWLISIFAPAKRGKTFWLQEIAIQAMMNNLKVVFISLEMGAHRVKKRMYRRLSAMGDESKNYIFPCFDCMKNQDGSCTKSIRTNSERLLNNKGLKPLFSELISYRPCSVCRSKNEDYAIATWFEMFHANKMNTVWGKKKLVAIGKMSRNNLKLKSYPAFSVSLTGLKHDLEMLEYSDDFIPDVIVIDYADILAPEDNRSTGREKIDETWKSLKNLADSKHCLVVTASQTNRGSFDKKNVVATDAAEDIRKIAHIDLGIALNQLPEEKRASTMRVSLIADRDGEFDQFKSAIVLQQLSLGQANLDSEIIIEKEKEGNENGNGKNIS